jgi:DNA-binding SARP family transcriptional activator
VEFRVLGPVEATVNGAPLELGGPKERALLAVLLLHANHAVPAAYLIDQLWQDQPPMAAPNLLHATCHGSAGCCGDRRLARRPAAS